MFDCTRQSSSVAISKQKKNQSYTATILISQLHLHYVIPNGNFNPRGVQVFIYSP